MWAKILACVLLAEAVSCQVEIDQTRRLRFRRPRPKLVEVENPDGELEGSPVPLLRTEESSQVFTRPKSGNDALNALIATAQKELDIQEVPTTAPLQLPVQQASEPESNVVLTNQLVGGRRRVPIPRRNNNNRPRPQPQQQQAVDVDVDGEVPRGRPRPIQRDEPTATLERYSHNNDDGSFTFGYVGADGSFREETRGVDCITRGKYGYIDPDGVKREYTYTSGLPCEIGEDNENELDGEPIIEDTIAPGDRFRQTQNEQLSEDQIPNAVKRQRIRQQANRVQQQEAAKASPEQSAFENFGVGTTAPQRQQVRPTSNANRGSALNNLINIADGSQPASRPTIRRPTAQAARPVAPSNPGSFDFDSELEGFTLNRPSLTFEQNRGQGESSAPQNTFKSELVFDQNSGTFQTQLKQNIQGGDQLNLRNNAAPFGVTPAPSSTINEQDFTLTTRGRPTTAVTPRPTSFAPTPTPAVPSRVVPAGTFKFDFEPLNIPTGPLPSPTTPAPRPTVALGTTPNSPSPRPTTVRLPAPTQPARIPTTPAAPRPITQAARRPAPAAPQSVPRPQPSAFPPRPQAAGPPRSSPNPQNTFFVFQPFNQPGAPAPQPQPASSPFNTPVNPNAFQIRQPPPGRPQTFFPGQLPVPQSQPAAGAPQPNAVRPAVPAPPQSAPRPAQPPAFRPPPVPAPTPFQQRPQSSPQLQFGFQPVPQQSQPGRPVPFTAFGAGAPRPQQLGVPPQQQQQFRAQPQLGVPPQLQRPVQGGPPPPQQARFAPQTFFPGQQPGRPLPGQLRGA